MQPLAQRFTRSVVSLLAILSVVLIPHSVLGASCYCSGLAVNGGGDFRPEDHCVSTLNARPLHSTADCVTIASVFNNDSANYQNYKCSYSDSDTCTSPIVCDNSVCSKSDLKCETLGDCNKYGGSSICIWESGSKGDEIRRPPGYCYFDTTAMNTYKRTPKVSGSLLPFGMGSFSADIQKPTLEITIPGVNFTDVDKTLDADGNIHIPWIGEYIAGIYTFLLGTASILAVFMIIVNGARILISAGGEGQAQGYHRIGQVVAGLVILWGSYFILTAINPDLTKFQALKLQYIRPEELAEPGTGEENGAVRSTPVQSTTNYNVTNQCFPVDQSSFSKISWNWGDDRDGGIRCHAGIDLYTSGSGVVRAIDDGIVTGEQPFKQCGAGPKTRALLVYHPSLGITALYGEINYGTIPKLKPGDGITRGEVLGNATSCGMLHFEVYRGDQVKNLKWFPPKGKSTLGENICAREYVFTKDPYLLDPTNLIQKLQNTFCPQIPPPNS